MAASDGLIILITGLGLYLIHPGWGRAADSNYLVTVSITSLIVILIFYLAQLYVVSNRDSLNRRTRKYLRIYTVSFLVLIAVTFAFKTSEEFSRIWVFSWFLVSAGLLGLERRLFYNMVCKWSSNGKLTRNLAIVGANEQANRLVRSIRTNDGPWIRIAGIFDDRSDRVPEAVEDCLVVGDLDRLIQEVREKRIDDVLIALPWSAERRMLEVLDRLKVLPVRMGLCPDTVGFNFPYHSFRQYGGIAVLDVADKPIDGWNSILKSIEDRLLGLLMLLLVLPVLLVISVLVKLDSPGGIFFRQTRYGFNDKPFEMLKFRTLYVDGQDKSAETLVTRDDPRVTRVGAFLRRTSLDELPQIINVLQGHMSLVGPRPHAMRAKAGGKYYQVVVREYSARHKVKPGITGWAQVNGWRGETDTEEKILKRVEYDLFYIEHWSILFDIRILLKTFQALFRSENAY
ncbi:MAG: undecaprenyl-phosphate glucose phosphotransferase [Gammaproteobacteria bacterium]|nr:undecaprenyl-phosphate glucose phosphotransferase [Gammaproteobacteria bacterium]